MESFWKWLSYFFWEIIMNNSLPGSESHNSSSKTLQDPFYSVLMANAILNICLCYPTIMMNILAIQALRKTPSLSKNLKTLLLNLAVSDLSVGVLGQPLYIVRRVGQLHGNLHKLRTSFSIVANVLFLSSFCGVTAASADRFVSIWKPLRYPQLVTHERVVITVIAIWLLSAFLGLANVFLLTEKMSFVIFFIIELFCFVSTTWFTLKVYLTIRRQNLQIQARAHSAQNSHIMIKDATLNKSAQSTYWIHFAFWVCYFPQFFVSCLRQFITHPHQQHTFMMILVSSWTLVLMNSALNPIIYCRKMRSIRRTMIDILQSIIRRIRLGLPFWRQLKNDVEVIHTAENLSWKTKRRVYTVRTWLQLGIILFHLNQFMTKF